MYKCKSKQSFLLGAPSAALAKIRAQRGNRVERELAQAVPPSSWIAKAQPTVLGLGPGPRFRARQAEYGLQTLVTAVQFNR